MVDRRGYAPRTAGCKPADFLNNLTARYLKSGMPTRCCPETFGFGIQTAQMLVPGMLVKGELTKMVRAEGIAPSSPGWQPGILLLDDVRKKTRRERLSGLSRRVHRKEQTPAVELSLDRPQVFECGRSPDSLGSGSATGYFENRNSVTARIDRTPGKVIFSLFATSDGLNGHHVLDRSKSRLRSVHRPGLELAFQAGHFFDLIRAWRLSCGQTRPLRGGMEKNKWLKVDCKKQKTRTTLIGGSGVDPGISVDFFFLTRRSSPIWLYHNFRGR